MKKTISLVFLLALSLSLSACSKEQKTTQNNQENIPPSQPSQFLENYTKSDWLNQLEEVTWENIHEEADNYSYNFKAESNETEKKLSYKKTANNDYQGTMEINFPSEQDSYILEVPKSFASHIDQLNFSIEPSNIINPDPIVEFKNVSGRIEIESRETKSETEIKKELEAQIIESEGKRCESLENNEAMACMLSLISKYRNSDYWEEELKDLNMAELAGGVAQAVKQTNLKVCRYVDNPNDRYSCYEYAYQTLIKDCDSKDGKEYRTCVRDLSSELPSYKEQRLFCGYIKDEAMRAECQGTAEMEVCDEIENLEQKNLCKINIVRTNNDIKACDSFENNDYKQVCIAVVGVGLNDTSYCDKIEDDYLNGLCRQKIAMQKNDQTVCEPIKDTGAKDICLGYFLTQEKSITQALCDSFHELFLKETCELGLAVINKDGDTCGNSKIISYDNQPICYFGIAVKHKDEDFCEKIRDEKLKTDCLNILEKVKTESTEEEKNTTQDKINEEKLADYPEMPDWMDCPIPEGTVLKNIGGGQTSGYYYYSNKTRGKVGPYMVWWGPNFDQPYRFVCYNEEGIKDGPYKYWNQNGTPESEGFFKDGEYHGVIKEYSKGKIRLLKTFENGVLNGLYQSYCTIDDKKCNAGDLIKSGNYVNGKKNGFWSTYKFGEFEFKEEFIDNEVTRDENGRNIKYY